MATRIVVLGLGNVLVGDDAFGPHVLRRLEAGWEMAPGVELLDGTPGLDLVPHLLGADVLIVVDTVRADGAPGELRVYDREAILRHPPQARVSPHDPGLKDTLFTLQLHDAAPRDVVLVGAIPADLSTGTRLSAPLRAALGPAVQAVLDALAAQGCPARPRTPAVPPSIWWESGAPARS